MSVVFCYILYSPSLNSFYIGSTILPPLERLENHLSKYYGNRKFTAKADDWEVFLEIPCTSIEQARNIERHIKKMKNRKYILNLKNYPEIVKKLLARYS